MRKSRNPVIEARPLWSGALSGAVFRGDIMSDRITCPKCGLGIEVSAALSEQVREHVQKEIEADAHRRNEKLDQKERILRQRELTVEEEITNRLAAERQLLAESAMQKARGDVGLELQDLRGQLKENREKLQQAQKAELEIRHDKQRLEDAKAEFELTINRRIDEERAQVREQAKRDAHEERRFKDAEKDKQIADLTRKINELEQLASRGAPGDCGEAAESTLEDELRREFPKDVIRSVAVEGDVLHEVRDSSGHACGTILWESKRTKKWADTWPAKAKEDQQKRNADVAVIATVAMPKDMSTFGSRDGVWVTSHHCVIGAALLLRHGMMETARSKRAGETRQTIMQELHGYLHSTEFRQHVEGILDPVVAMKKALGTEKRSHEKVWKERERQLDHAERNAAGMHGSLDAILGGTLPRIPLLDSGVVREELDDGLNANGIRCLELQTAGV